MNEKIRTFFKQNIGYFIVAFASIVYILTAFLTVDKTGKTPTQIIADGAIAFFLGLFINRIFDLQGIMSGEREEKVISTKEEHGQLVLKISPHIDKLDAWCEKENAQNYVIQRTKILARAGLKYDECFDENGVAKDWRPDSDKMKNKALVKSELKKWRAFSKAVGLKLTALTTSDLTSEGGKQQDPFWLGRTKAQYETGRGIKEVISKTGTALIFGYYGVRLIEDFNFANLIWTTLQVALFLVMGVISMYKSYIFIVDEFRGRIIKKIDNLQKFDNYINTLPKEDILIAPIKTETQNTEVKNDE